MADLAAAERVRILEWILSRMHASIAAADAKTGGVFALDAAMLGVLAVLVPRPSDWQTSAGVAAVLAFMFLASSIILLSIASFPRRSGPKDSVLYFRAIRRRPVVEFEAQMKGLSEDRYVSDLVEQCHRNASIADRKYIWVQLAMVAMYLGVSPWIVAVFALYRSRK